MVPEMSILGRRTNDLDEANGTAPLILTQLASFEQFVADQERGSWGNEGALRNGGKSVIKALTQIDTQFPVANSGPPMTRRKVKIFQLPRGVTSIAYIKSTISHVKTLLNAGVKKSRPLKGCSMLKEAQSQLKAALVPLVKDGWKKVSDKILTAKRNCEVCLRVINPMKEDYGQRGLSSAYGQLVAAIEVLTRQQYSRGPRQMSQSVINFVSDGTDPDNLTSSGANYQLRVDGSGGSRMHSQVFYTS